MPPLSESGQVSRHTDNQPDHITESILLGMAFWMALHPKGRIIRRCNSVQSVADQSFRSAIIGSTLVARRAGSQQASSAAPASIKGTRIKVSESVALTP
jgi:hypothetical protein